MMRDPYSQLGMSDGWSSSKDLLDSPYLDPLTTFIHSKIGHLPLSGWGNILLQGQHIGPHNHSRGLEDDTWLSGVYYLTAGTLILGGTFHMEPGQLIIFKSSQFHEVPPAEDLRVTIAFNARRV